MRLLKVEEMLKLKDSVAVTPDFFDRLLAATIGDPRFYKKQIPHLHGVITRA
jgi:hypothetical protein